MRDIDSFTALNRFGMGAGPGDKALIGDDPRGFVQAQVRPPVAVPAELAGFSSSAAMIRDYAVARRARDGSIQQVNRSQFALFRDEVLAATALVVATPTPLVERMVRFWSNHFTVSRSRGPIANMIPAYEREAIRPHVFGRFADMLKAVVRHPCMLIYLDNPSSMGPNSVSGAGRIRRQGLETTLNENLAREVLELHTLGVDGGYAQEDVIQFALALTGWSHGGLRRGGDEEIHGGFVFVRRQHEPGPKTILGRLYPEDGEAEVLHILDDLARHPATAHHLATKLVRHFVADDPPDDAVRRIARVYLDHDGDLAAVTRAVAALDAAWADPLAKVKSHQDFVLAVNRAAGNADPRVPDVFRPLRLLGQFPYLAPSPQGWGDRAEDWIGPESVMIRLEWAHQFAARRAGGQDLRRAFEASIGAVARDATRTWVFRAPSQDAGLTMIWTSPEFQRR